MLPECAPARPEPTRPVTSLMELPHSRPLTPALITPGLEARQSWPVPTLQSLLKLFRLANPEPSYLPHPFFSMESIKRKALVYIAPHSLCLLTDPGALSRGPHGKVCPSFWEQGNKLSFQWQLCPDPLVLSYLNTKKLLF